jgi:hypothetical protein
MKRIKECLPALLLGLVLVAGDGLAAEVTGQVLAVHRLTTQPFPDERATIELSGPQGSWSGQASGDGRYMLSGVAPGTYSLSIRSPYGEVQRKVRVTGEARNDLGSDVVGR